MGGSFKDVPRLLNQALKNLAPGGWLEWQEYETMLRTDDGSLPPDSAMLRWLSHLNAAADKFGKPMNIAPMIKTLMEQAGFTKVQERVCKVHPHLGSYLS